MDSMAFQKMGGKGVNTLVNAGHEDLVGGNLLDGQQNPRAVGRHLGAILPGGGTGQQQPVTADELVGEIRVLQPVGDEDVVDLPPVEQLFQLFHGPQTKRKLDVGHHLLQRFH